MKQQIAFAVACGITAFLLVGGSAVVTSWRNQSTAADAVVTTIAAGGMTADERTVFLAREAVYQQRIAEANRRLAATATNSQPANARTASDATPRVSAADATQIAYAAALAHISAPQLRHTELVRFQGVVAYEILLDDGVVYVDAASGAVLFNKWTPTKWTPTPPPANSDLTAAIPQDTQPQPPAVDSPAPIYSDEHDEDEEHDEEHEEDGDEEHDDD